MGAATRSRKPAGMPRTRQNRRGASATIACLRAFRITSAPPGPMSMTSSSAASLLSDVTLAPRDPILGVTEAFNADPNPRKVNLGVGVYINDDGKVPLLDCVKRAEV